MISRFQPADMEEVLSIWLTASIRAHDFIDPQFWQNKVNDMRTIYLPSAQTWVYKEHNTIAGFISIYGMTLAAIFVRPEEQKRGIGGELLNYVKKQHAHLELTAYKANTASIAFYKKNGFVTVSEQTDTHTHMSEIAMTWRRAQ